jgi:hypothetical protein
MADAVTDPEAEHDARYGDEGARPPEALRRVDLCLLWMAEDICAS